MQKNKKTTKKLSLILSLVFVVVCVALLIGAAYAWFTVLDKPIIDGSQVVITKEEHNGYHYTKFNGEQMPSDGMIIYPGDKFVFDVEAIEDNLIFGVKANVKPLSDTDFKARFENRPDLVNGLYQVKQSLQTTNDPTEVFKSFDVDFHLSKTTLSDEGKQKEKQDFFKAFASSNSLCDALTIRVVKVGDFDCNIILSSDDESLTQKEYYLDGFTNIAKGTIIKLEFAYNNDNYLPTANFKFTGDTEQQTYKSQNYNCFIGQSLNLSFLNLPAI